MSGCGRGASPYPCRWLFFQAFCFGFGFGFGLGLGFLMLLVMRARRGLCASQQPCASWMRRAYPRLWFWTTSIQSASLAALLPGGTKGI